MEMVIFVGIQATGKSEFYKRTFFKTHVRINLDMLKTRNREAILIEACLAAKQPFVVDNTNPTKDSRAGYLAKAKDAGFTIRGYYFRSSIKEALARNELRDGRERIPEKGMLGAYAKLEIPEMSEGFDSLCYVFINEQGEFVAGGFDNEI